MRKKASAIWGRVRPWVPFIAFACGFGFDSITLGREVSRFDLYLVSFYGTFALAAILLQTQALPPRLRTAVGYVLQFCLGGSLSAVVVLYFRSSGQLYSLLFVAGLFAAMVANELAHRHEPQREVVWGMWSISAAMLANFVVPYVIGSVSPWWFYLSVLVTIGIIVGVRTLARAPWRSLRLAIAASALLAVLWAAGAVPPVPLVLRNNLICTNYEKKARQYACDVDEQTVFQRLGLTPRVVSRDDGEAVYVLTAVFAPPDVDVVVEHRWYRAADDGWEFTDDMEFHMQGGRRDGWRFWSRKRNAREGLWRIETALQGGSVLASETFRVVEPAKTDKKRKAL